MRISINLELSNIDQLRAVESALEMYIDMADASREDRIKEKSWTKQDAAEFDAAKELLRSMGQRVK